MDEKYVYRKVRGVTLRILNRMDDMDCLRCDCKIGGHWEDLFCLIYKNEKELLHTNVKALSCFSDAAEAEAVLRGTGMPEKRAKAIVEDNYRRTEPFH